MPNVEDALKHVGVVKEEEGRVVRWYTACKLCNMRWKGVTRKHCARYAFEHWVKAHSKTPLEQLTGTDEEDA